MMQNSTIKSVLLIATAFSLQSAAGVEISKSVLSKHHAVQDFKCVSQTAFRKFDNYIGKVMNRNMTDDVIFCDYQYEGMDDNLHIIEEQQTWQPSGSEQDNQSSSSTLDIMRAASFDPELLPIPEYVLNQAVKNRPLTPEMEIFNFSNGEYEYLVFKDVQLRERELKIKQDFQKWLTQNNLTIPECFAHDNNDLRFYLASGRDFQQTYNAMVENEKWMLETQVTLFARYPEFKRFLDGGVFYGYQRDKQGRPVMFFSMKKALDMGMDNDSFLECADFIATYTQYHAMVPGKVETWNMVVDFKGVGLGQIPMSQLRQMASRMKSNYKLRLHNMITVNTHWLIKQASAVINTFLDARITNKIKILSDNGGSYLDQLIGKDHLEQKYGGNLPNLTEEFFPPRYNPL